jgi:hypothetical protein
MTGMTQCFVRNHRFTINPDGVSIKPIFYSWRGSLDADHLFYGNVSHGGARFPAQLQDASDRQANDDESADKHTERY